MLSRVEPQECDLIEEAAETGDTEQECVMVSTVADKITKYSSSDYRAAELARKIQQTIGNPSTRDYLRIIDNRELPNVPVTRKDVLAAEDIFGPNLQALKGKTTRRCWPSGRTSSGPIRIPSSNLSPPASP